MTDTIRLKLFSADSHISEPGDCYVDNIEAKYRDRAPRLEKGPMGGDVYVIDDYVLPFPAAHSASAGMNLSKAKFAEMSLADAHRGAFDPKARIADQDRDGVLGEILYPSIGMVVCGNRDADYKAACMRAYNRWLRGFVATSPERLIGLGMTAVRSINEAVGDLQAIAEVGFKGVMLPAEPAMDADYADPVFDPLWRAAIELGLPVSFHTGTNSGDRDRLAGRTRGGGRANMIHEIMRINQDIIGAFIWGGVFERNPALRLVCVEADAGWAPHYMQRMDHYWRERPDLKLEGLPRAPSDYFKTNVYLTFQNDWVAFDMLDRMNVGRLMWANDFPHPDSTWPNSQAMLTEHAGGLSEEQKQQIFLDNVRHLYGLTTPSRIASGDELN